MIDAPTLPPLALLPTFELAARLQSFKAAAAQLHLSPSAVSQQIRALEEAVGVSLFIREVRSIRLTAAGRRYVEAIRPALTEIAAATAALKRAPLPQVLRVTTVPFVAHELMIPHLKTFSEHCAGRSLHVETAPGLQDTRLHAGEIDAAIRMGMGRWPRLAAKKVGDIASSPVCAPDMAAALTGPEALATLPLISVRGHEERTWRPLADRYGFTYNPASHPVFETYFETLRAAEAGLGVTQGLFPLVQTIIDRGRLVAPLPLLWPSSAALYLVTRLEDRDDPVMTQLHAWLAERYAALG